MFVANFMSNIISAQTDKYFKRKIFNQKRKFLKFEYLYDLLFFIFEFWNSRNLIKVRNFCLIIFLELFVFINSYSYKHFWNMSFRQFEVKYPYIINFLKLINTSNTALALCYSYTCANLTTGEARGAYCTFNCHTRVWSDCIVSFIT